MLPLRSPRLLRLHIPPPHAPLSVTPPHTSSLSAPRTLTSNRAPLVPLPHLSLLDVMFSYTTPKIVRVMDARLGLFKKVAQVIIVIYIIVYKLIGDLGYIKFETVRWRAASPLLSFLTRRNTPFSCETLRRVSYE